MVLPVAIGTPSEDWPLPLWLLEVSDTSYRKDSTIKLRVYAEAGITDYWILNINARRLEVHREPAVIDGTWRYRSSTHLGRGESVTTINGPRVTFAVDDFLPPE